MFELDELRARPHDRAQWQAYADWLQQRGDPRGELIAVQEAAEQCATPERYAELRARARALFEAHSSLRPPLPSNDWDQTRGAWASWRCGHVRTLELDLGAHWLGPPRVRAPRALLRNRTQMFAALLDHPSLALLERLTLRLHLADGASIGKLAFTGLEHLRASSTSPPHIELAHDGPSFGMLASSMGSMYRELPTSALDTGRFMDREDTPALPALGSLARSLRALMLGWEMIWIDAHGRSHGNWRLAASGRPDGLFSVYSMPRLLARRLAAQTPLLFPTSPTLPERRIARMLDTLAPRLDKLGRAITPRKAWSRAPQRVGLGPSLPPLRPLGDDATRALMALRELEGIEQWYCLHEPLRLHRTSPTSFRSPTLCSWEALVGLGPEQLLCLAVIKPLG